MLSSSTSSSSSHFNESTSSISSCSTVHKAGSESIGMSEEVFGSGVREDHVDAASRAWKSLKTTFLARQDMSGRVHTSYIFF